MTGVQTCALPIWSSVQSRQTAPLFLTARVKRKRVGFTGQRTAFDVRDASLSNSRGGSSATLGQRVPSRNNMTQNSNRGNAPRHPRSPMPKQDTRPHGGSAALFNAPPKKPVNWLDDHAAPQMPVATPRAPVTAVTPPRREGGSPATPHPPQHLRSHVPVPESIHPLSAPIIMDAATPAHDNGFAALGLRDELVRAVLAHGYSTPTPIQKQAIPAVLEGGDLLGGAQTGTGKTRSEERRVGKECIPPCRSRWSPYH